MTKHLWELTNAMWQARRPNRGAGFSTIASECGAALQDVSGNAAVLDSGANQEFGIRQSPCGVLHVSRVCAVHNYWGEGMKKRQSWEGWHLNLLKVKVLQTPISKDTQLCLTHSSHRTEAGCSSLGPPDRSGFHCPRGRTPGRTDMWCELRAPALHEMWSSSRSGSQVDLDTSHCVIPLENRGKMTELHT